MSHSSTSGPPPLNPRARISTVKLLLHSSGEGCQFSFHLVSNVTVIVLCTLILVLMVIVIVIVSICIGTATTAAKGNFVFAFDLEVFASLCENPFQRAG